MKYNHPDILSNDKSKAPSSMFVRRTNISTDNPNLIIQGPFYHVSTDMSRVPINDYMDHGYETRREFKEAIEHLLHLWGGRDGECVEERAFHGKEGEAIDQRHRQLHLRFHDTPGGSPEAAWLPLYLLEPTSVPDYARWQDPTPEEELEYEIQQMMWEKIKD